MTTEVDHPPIRRPEYGTEAWWLAYRSRIPAGYFELIEAEAHAARILHYHPIFIPGLLQTQDYAAAITPATSLKELPPQDTADLVDVRMRRQRAKLDGLTTTELVFLLDETSLRRPVGRASTMRGQLDHLLGMLGRPSITLAVVPFQAQPHPGMLGAFMLLQFADPQLQDVLCFDGPLGNVVVRDQPDLAAAYGRLAERLVAAGWRGDAAAWAIRRARDHAG